jgi:CRISPR system Cascade subunit CasE
MYLSRISLSPHANAQQVARQVCRDAYREHQFLWRLFENDPEARRDFLFRRDNEARRPRFYLLSRRPPRSADGPWQTESKSFEPRLQAGQQLVFSLRANPVVTRRDSAGHQARHDVVMDLKHRMDYRHMPRLERPPLAELVYEAGTDWLQQRAEKHGFSIVTDTLRVDGYLRHRAFKRSSKQPICYSTLDFTGLLRIDDAERFHQALLQGIGPAKAFGCGLLLVRRQGG